MLLKRLIFYSLAVLGALLLAITLTPVVPSYVQATEPDWYDGNGEVLVVLGGSMLISGAGKPGTLGYDTYLRCIYASWVLRTQKFHYVVVTGGGGLAEAMGRFLTQNGVDPRSILTERSAQSTFQNAVFTRRILQTQYGSGSHLPEVVVLTSDYHAWRARLVFQHAGLRVRMIPAPDVIKRSALRSFRVMGAVDVLSEWAKDIFYIISGRA